MANSSKLKLSSAHLLPRFFFSERNALLFLGRVHYLPEKSRKKMNSLADNYITPFLTLLATSPYSLRMGTIKSVYFQIHLERFSSI